MDLFFTLGFGLGAVVVTTVLARIVSLISRITHVGESYVRIQPLLGTEQAVPLTKIVDVSLVSFLGIQTHAVIRLQQTRFWSLAHNIFFVPVRGIFMDQQGPIKQLWNQVPCLVRRL